MNINLTRYSTNLIITNKTPLDVLLFLLKTSGKTIEKEKILKKLDKIKLFLSNYSLEIPKRDFYNVGEELLKITCFISDIEQEWNVENLNLAFQHFLNFQDKFFETNLNEIKLGSKTNEFPKNYDICMIFFICKKLNIETVSEDTIFTMFEKIKNSLITKEKVFENIRKRISSTSLLNLNLINQLLHKTDKLPEIETENLKTLSKTININYIIGNSILTQEEAIVYAGKFLNYDISLAKYPIETLYCLKDKKEIDFNDEFSKKFLINPKFFKMDKFWKKNIEFLYGTKTLQVLKNYESLENLEDSLEKENWFEGIVDFNFLPKEDTFYVSFGKLNDRNLKVFDIEFLENNFFTQEIPNNRLEKLNTICKENKFDEISSLIERLNFTDNIVSKTQINYFSNNIEKNIFIKIKDFSQVLKDKKEIEDIENLSIMESIKEIINFMKKEECKTEFYKLPLVLKKEQNYVKTKENFYTYLLEDLESIDTFTGKTEEYIKKKYIHYSNSSDFYLYSFFGEKSFSLQKSQ